MQDALDCTPQTGPPTSGEAAFINDVRGHVPGDDAQLLTIVRGTCGVLVGGTSAGYLASDFYPPRNQRRTPPVQGCLKLFAPISHKPTAGRLSERHRMMYRPWLEFDRSH
jgi:hypothetical protein